MSHTPSSTQRIELECNDKPTTVDIFPDTFPLVDTDTAPTTSTKHGVIGYICIAVCLLSWILISELEPILFPSSYRKPYLLNYLAQIAMILMIIPWAILKLRDSSFSLFCSNTKPVMSATTSINLSNIPNYGTSIPTINSINTAMPDLYTQTHCLSSNLYTKCRTLLIPSLSVAFLIFGSNYLWFISLYYTIASVNNTLYQSQCAFVLIFSVLLLKQRLNKFSILSVALSIAGVVIISLLGDEAEADANVEPDTFGLVMCVAASMFYALAQVRMSQIEAQYFDVKHTMRDTLLFQFLMGVDVLVLGVPGFFALDMLGVETMEVPDVAECGGLFVMTMLTMLFMAALLCGIAQRGALFMSMGILLVIPVTFGVDMAFYGLVITPWTMAGSMCILVGFVVMHVKGIPTDADSEAADVGQKEKEAEFVPFRANLKSACRPSA